MDGFVATLVDGAPGAFGSGPVVTVGCGAAGSVCVETMIWPRVPVPEPTLTPGCVATIVVPDPDVVAAATAVATMAMTRKSSAGQIQSPGYHANRRCHAAASIPTGPRFVGSRSPHSRQYSWSGS